MKEKQLKPFGRVEEGVSLKELTTFKVGGKAEFVVYPDNSHDVKDLLEFLKEENVKYYILGNGSNVIFSDKDFEGVIINLTEMQAVEIYPAINGVFAEAGAMISRVVQETVDAGLTGLEWAAGIPGTIGGCVVGNAGAYKSSMADFIKSVTVINPEGNLCKLEKDDISFDYRTSMFKENSGYIVLVAELELQKGDKAEAVDLMADRARRRVEAQPLDFPSAGSIFRNPENDFAGRLIEECGLKGKRIGGAEISVKHANFIINVDNASANDIKELIELVHDEVLKKFNIDLIMEQEYVNF